jgi:hypothetical protein
LETDGPDSLLVNEIGAYSGQHLINENEGSLTSKFTITADASWTLTVADVTTVKSFSGTATGHGDSVINFTSSFDTAAVQNIGDSNFVVTTYGGGQDMPVNEIGSYRGVVNFTAPGLVQIESNGNWSITPQ